MIRRVVIQTPLDPSQAQFTGKVLATATLLLFGCAAMILLKGIDWIAGLTAISATIHGWLLRDIQHQQLRNAKLLSLIGSILSAAIVLMSFSMWTLNRGPGLVQLILLLIGTTVSIYGTLRIHSIR